MMLGGTECIQEGRYQRTPIGVMLVVQRFGRGRTAALMIGDIWHWGLHDAEAHRDMDKAWRQLMRWLVTDVPNRVDLTVQPQTDEPNGAVELQVRVRDPKFQPLDN